MIYCQGRYQFSRRLHVAYTSLRTTSGFCHVHLVAWVKSNIHKKKTMYVFDFLLTSLYDLCSFLYQTTQLKTTIVKGLVQRAGPIAIQFPCNKRNVSLVYSISVRVHSRHGRSETKPSVQILVPYRCIGVDGKKPNDKRFTRANTRKLGKRVENSRSLT